MTYESDHEVISITTSKVPQLFQYRFVHLNFPLAFPHGFHITSSKTTAYLCSKAHSLREWYIKNKAFFSSSVYCIFLTCPSILFPKTITGNQHIVKISY